MSSTAHTAPTRPISIRVEQRHADILRDIAARNASTISRTAGRLIADRLDHMPVATFAGELPKADTDGADHH